MSSFFPDFKKERKKKLKNGSWNCQSDLEVRSSKWVPRKSERIIFQNIARNQERKTNCRNLYHQL